MKKMMLMLMLMVLTITSSFALFVEIGDGDSSTSNVPLNGLYDYSWSNYILTSDQIGVAIDINEILFNVANTPGSYATENQQIYMKLTTDTEVTAGYPAPANNGFTLVFDGAITWDQGGWQGTMLDSPFAYDGTSNLQIAWDNNDGTWSSGHPSFFKTDTTLNVAADASGDNTFPADGGQFRTFFPNTRLGFIAEGAPGLPVVVSPAHNSLNNALDTELVWTIGDDTDAIHLYFSQNEADVVADAETALAVDGELVTSFSPTLENAGVYYWKVVASNNISDVTVSTSVHSFSTAYGVAETPYTEDFENLVAPALPLGWMSHLVSTTSYSYVDTYAYDPYEGVNSLRISNNEDAEGTYIAVLPEIENMGNRIKFYAKCSVADAQLTVGYLTDASDAETFTEIETVNLTADYQEHSVVLELSRTVRFVGFKHTNVATYQTIYVDNVLIEEIPENEPIPATLLTPVNGATQVATDAELTWENGLNTVSVNLYLSDDMTEVADADAAAMVVNSQDITSYTADLEEWTTYYWRVGSLNSDAYEVLSTISSFSTVLPEGTIQIGDGTGINVGMPMEPYWGCTYTQTIYPQTAINTAGNIQSVAWHYNGNSAWGPDDIKIYMAHTDSTTFGTTESWIAASELTLVYDGTLTVSAVDGWVPITLDTPFNYNNTDNLVIAFEENTQGYHDSDDEFFNTAADGNVSITYRNDTINPDPTDPPLGIVKADYPNIVLAIEASDPPVSYPAPTNFTAVVADVNNVQIDWDAPAEDENAAELTGYTLYRNDEMLVEAGTTVMSYLDETLANGTYEYKAVANYDEMDSDSTPVVTVVIEETVVVEAPFNLTATVSGQDVTLNWLAPGTVIPDEITEGFEESFPPTGWTTVVNNTTESWMQYEEIVFTSGNVTPTEGMYQAGVMWDYAAQDEWLITGEISNVNNLTFDFYGHYGSTNGDNYYVKVSTDGGTNWTPVWNATDLPEADNYYDTPISIDLSAYASETINVAWNFVDGDGAGLWYASYIDNIIFSNNGRAVALNASELKSFSKAEPKTVSTRNNVARFAKNPNYVSTRTTRELTGYKLYRDAVEVATVSSDVLTYTDAELDFANYDYYVTAVYTTGESDPSNTVTVSIVDPSTTLPPTNLTGTANGADVELAWEAPLDLSEGLWITKGAEDNNDGIGTGSAAVISVSHMYTEDELAMYQGMYINSMKIFPREATATYTLKVWGGADGNTELYSQAITDFVNEAWNEYALVSTVAIPTTGPVYIGYVADTPTGFPAGSDVGPSVPGGDMIKLGDQATWDILSAIAPTLNINWNIQAFVSPEGDDRVAYTPALMTTKNVETTNIINNDTIIAGNLNPIVSARFNVERDVTAYKIYRDNEEIAEVAATVFNYTDSDLANGAYVYHITAMYDVAESLNSNSITVNVNVSSGDYLIEDSFETYTDFSLAAAPWTIIDGDLSPTYGFTGIAFENSGAPMGYIVFNPSMTTPPLEDDASAAYDGSKYMAAFAGTTPPNNDWLITQEFTLGDTGTFNFWGKTFQDYGMERFNVLVSNGSTNPNDFTSISGATYTEAPLTWTQFSYSLDAYANQSIRVAIQCVSNDVFVFMVDQVQIEAPGGTDNDSNETLAVSQLKGNYPNPFNPETRIAFSTRENGPVSIDIFNIKGQKVRSLLNENREAGAHSVVWNGTDDNGKKVASGVFFYRMKSGNYSSTKKMILMK